VLREVDAFEGRLGQYQPRNDSSATSSPAIPPVSRPPRADHHFALHALASHLGRIADVRKTALVVTEGFVPVRSAAAESCCPRSTS